MVTAYLGPDRRLARLSPMQVSLATTALAGVGFVTLCPIGLRPHVAPANLERFWAFVLLGALISRAAGRRVLAATAAVVVAAVLLEAAQRLIPGRHAAMADAQVKALGGLFGVVVAQAAYPIRRWAAGLGAQTLAPAVRETR